MRLVGQTVQTARTDHQALVKALEERLPSMKKRAHLQHGQPVTLDTTRSSPDGLWSFTQITPDHADHTQSPKSTRYALARLRARLHEAKRELDAFISSIQSRSVREEDVQRFNELDDRLTILRPILRTTHTGKRRLMNMLPGIEDVPTSPRKLNTLCERLPRAPMPTSSMKRASLVHDLGSMETVESGLGCHCETHRCTVTMAIATDIDDSTFRAAFISAVETYFSGSATGGISA